MHRKSTQELPPGEPEIPPEEPAEPQPAASAPEGAPAAQAQVMLQLQVSWISERFQLELSIPNQDSTTHSEWFVEGREID